MALIRIFFSCLEIETGTREMMLQIKGKLTCMFFTLFVPHNTRIWMLLGYRLSLIFLSIVQTTFTCLFIWGRSHFSFWQTTSYGPLSTDEINSFLLSRCLVRHMRVYLNEYSQLFNHQHVPLINLSEIFKCFAHNRLLNSSNKH